MYPLLGGSTVHYYMIFRWLKLKGRNKEALIILSRVNRHFNTPEKALEAKEDETKEDETRSDKVNKLYLIKELFEYKYRYIVHICCEEKLVCIPFRAAMFYIVFRKSLRPFLVVASTLNAI